MTTKKCGAKKLKQNLNELTKQVANDDNSYKMFIEILSFVIFRWLRFCIFPKNYHHHLPNELNAECLQNLKILHFKRTYYENKAPFATHSILLFRWMARTMNRKELNVLFFSFFSFFCFMHKFNEICCVRSENCVVCHIQWMLKMKEPK